MGNSRCLSELKSICKMVEMKIKNIQHYDIKGVYDLFTNGSISFSMEFEPCDLLDFTSIVDEWKKNGEVLLGEVKDNIVAACQVSRRKFRTKHSVHLSSFAVLSDCRHKGTDKRFLKKIVKRLKDDGAKRIDLTIGENDHSALSFFTENGFQVEGKLDQFFYCSHSGRYLGGYLMAAVFPDTTDGSGPYFQR